MNHSKPSVNGYLTVEKAAVELDVAVASIWRFVRAGLLTRHRLLGRTLVAASDVEALKASRAAK